MSVLVTAGKAPLPGLKDMVTDYTLTHKAKQLKDMVADTLTHKAKEKKAEAEKSTQELGDNHEMSTMSTVR